MYTVSENKQANGTVPRNESVSGMLNSLYGPWAHRQVNH